MRPFTRPCDGLQHFWTISTDHQIQDISSWGSQVALFAAATARFGPRIDYVFANAGITQMSQMRQTDSTHFATSALSPAELAKSGPPDLKVIEVNTTGTLYTVHLALSYFRAQEPVNGWRGKLVVTGSSAGFYPFANDALYGASKASNLGLVRALGPKVLREAITINLLAPSCIRTEIGPQDFFDMLEREGRLTPMKTGLRAVDMFTDEKRSLTGQMAELSVHSVVLRKPPVLLDESVEKNLDAFHSNAETDAALDVGEHEAL